MRVMVMMPEAQALQLKNCTIAIQKSGRLTQSSLKWLNTNTSATLQESNAPFGKRRELYDVKNNLSIIGLSNKDIFKAVATGLADYGIGGIDVLTEYNLANPSNTLKIVAGLDFSFCRLAVARPKDAQTNKIKSVVTTYPLIAEQYFSERNQYPAITVYGGGIEMIARRGKYDALVDIVDSGDSLKANEFVESRTILYSHAVLFERSNKGGMP